MGKPEKSWTAFLCGRLSRFMKSILIRGRLIRFKDPMWDGRLGGSVCASAIA